MSDTIDWFSDTYNLTYILGVTVGQPKFTNALPNGLIHTKSWAYVEASCSMTLLKLYCELMCTAPAVLKVAI